MVTYAPSRNRGQGCLRSSHITRVETPPPRLTIGRPFAHSGVPQPREALFRTLKKWESEPHLERRPTARTHQSNRERCLAERREGRVSCRWTLAVAFHTPRAVNASVRSSHLQPTIEDHLYLLLLAMAAHARFPAGTWWAAGRWRRPSSAVPAPPPSCLMPMLQEIP